MPTSTPFSTRKSKEQTLTAKAKKEKKADKADLLHSLLESLLQVGINLAKHRL
jgi:hypothetical protein